MATKKNSRAYAFGREMVCSQKSVRNGNFFENAGHVSFSFCQNWFSRDAHKTMQNQPRGYVDQAASHLLGPRGQLGWGGVGLALAILVGLAKNSDIGRVGKKMVLRRIPLYFLSTIFHSYLKPKPVDLGSSVGTS